MAVRRLRESVANHNWFMVAVDFAVLVAGVFLGIQASNWNQARIDDRDARKNRAMLIDDLRANQTNLATRKRYYSWVRDEGLKTLTALGHPREQLGPRFLVDAYQATQILPWSLKQNTYQQLIASGHFAQLGDASLRDEISNYYVGADVTGVNLATVMPYRDTVRRAMPYAVQNKIRNDCGEKIGENARGEPIMVLPGDCSIGLDRAALQTAIAKVLDAPGLGSDLNRQLVDLDQKLISVDVIARRAAKLERRLRGLP